MGKKVFSFCLWGNNPKYTIGAIKNLVSVQTFYPGFECWIYLDSKTIQSNIVDILKTQGAKLIDREGGGWHSMFWRFEPAGDPSVEVVMVRDCDCRMIERERAAVKEWLKSDKDFHVMRDHPSHDTHILGGLWGARGDVIRNINELISKWKIVSAYQNDQLFLKSAVWPVVSKKTFVHDSCWHRTRQFPVKRRLFEFVGESFQADDSPGNAGHRILLQRYLAKHGELER